MAMLELRVNGRLVRADVEPRLQLAEFLRQNLDLTATNVGCEQGVCGACTVLQDGKPVRSCISYAVMFEGREITTLEGLNGDPLMQDLQKAFSDRHALQCGFCTPGMLISAHDLIRRKGALDEAAIRHAMSGNLCRCTGYMGIVAAIGDIGLQQSGGQPEAAAKPKAGGLGKVVPAFELSADSVADSTAHAASSDEGLVDGDPPQPGWTRVRQDFAVEQEIEAVWQYFSDPENIAGCFPGAKLTAFDGHDIAGTIEVNFGPITARFAGTGRFDLEPAYRRGALQGSGADKRGGNQVKAHVGFALSPGSGSGTGAASTEVSVVVDYVLSGPLAQFGRSGLVRDFANRLSQRFAGNLNRAMAGGDNGGETMEGGEISIIATTLSILWTRIRSLFGR